jgi:hypothetical protein
MKIKLFAFSGILVGGLLTACGTEVSEEPRESKLNETTTEVKAEAATTAPKDWKDLSSVGDLTKPDFATNAKDWITETLDVLKQETPEKYIEAGYDEAYDQYLKAQGITNVLGKYVKVEGGDLEVDFKNIQMLAQIIQEEHEKRTEHLSLEYLQEKYGHNKQEAVKDWKPATERQEQAFVYLLQLVHDVDVAINERHGIPYFGVSHFAEGEQVNGLEAFINNKEMAS